MEDALANAEAVDNLAVHLLPVCGLPADAAVLGAVSVEAVLGILVNEVACLDAVVDGALGDLVARGRLAVAAVLAIGHLDAEASLENLAGLGTVLRGATEDLVPARRLGDTGALGFVEAVAGPHHVAVAGTVDKLLAARCDSPTRERSWVADATSLLGSMSDNVAVDLARNGASLDGVDNFASLAVDSPVLGRLDIAVELGIGLREAVASGLNVAGTNGGVSVKVAAENFVGAWNLGVAVELAVVEAAAVAKANSFDPAGKVAVQLLALANDVSFGGSLESAASGAATLVLSAPTCLVSGNAAGPDTVG